MRKKLISKKTVKNKKFDLSRFLFFLNPKTKTLKTIFSTLRIYLTFCSKFNIVGLTQQKLNFERLITIGQTKAQLGPTARRWGIGEGLSPSKRIRVSCTPHEFRAAENGLVHILG